MTTKETQEKIIDNMRRWQKVENSSVVSTGAVIEKTDNPIIRLVMEIIQRDSQMHYRIQEMIANSLESETISLSPDELGKVWDMIEMHIRIEEQTIKLANILLIICLLTSRNTIRYWKHWKQLKRACILMDDKGLETQLIQKVIIDCFINRIYRRYLCLMNQLDVLNQPGQ